MKKNIYDKNVSYWIQIYFDWMKIKKKGHIMKIYFIEYKFILIGLEIYFDIMKKGDIMKIYFIKYIVILTE